jgi:uncharacterized protein (TIGR00661 family)
MNQAREGKKQGKPRILVAPLDWGLGHATRCIPVIRELLGQGAEVWLAGKDAQETLLRSEFPNLSFLRLPGYNVRYAKTRWGLVKNIFFQVPSILRSIKREHAWLEKVIKEHEFDAVISDNRYGLYHQETRCVFITHQLVIKSPLGSWSERWLQKRNYKYINRFTSCWIPDEDGNNNLAGELSHPAKKLSIPIHYAGVLSRFSKDPVAEKKGHVLVILSGPEPQRSIFEEMIIKEIAHYNGTATVVRGLLSSSSAIIPSTNMIRFFNHLPAAELNTEIQQAEFVIGRCGYSTVMDIVKLQKKSILVPTPGQTEQEYLSAYLTEKNIIYSTPQKDFSLSGSLDTARVFPYQSFLYNDVLLKITVEQLLEKLL